MLPAARALVAELEAETPATRRVLERLPEADFGWRPHPKSLSVGQLALHVASIPGNVSRIAQFDGMDLATRSFDYAACDSKHTLLATLDSSVGATRQFLEELDEVRANATWRLTFGEREIFAMPRLNVVRTMGLNHWYHHRGELVVYLRLLNVAVPVVYGRSADESPFTQPAA